MRDAIADRNVLGSSNPSLHRLVLTFDVFFTVIFTTELFLRVLVMQQLFCLSPDWYWNGFDTLIVIAALVEVALTSYSFEINYIRVLRLCRVIRALRVARLIPLFGKLQALINAFLSSLASLVWAMAVLVFLMFLFAIIFMQGATQYIDQAETGDANVEFLKTFFGSMTMTLLSLFMSVTSGLSWWEIERVFLEIHPVYGMLYVVYIATMVLSLLNIVTGICVNNALEMAQQDRDFMMKQELDRKAAYVGCLEGVFHKLDQDASGRISFEDFIQHLERQEVSALFSVLGIEVSDAIAFFEALDVDGSHELEIDEFVVGCLNLRGNVRNVDMSTLLRENKRLMQCIGKTAKRTETQLQDIICRLPYCDQRKSISSFGATSRTTNRMNSHLTESQSDTSDDFLSGEIATI